jgi:hypothetical protein
MKSPRSPKSPGSSGRNCFCGCLASPCRDNKYCSEQCAREDTEKMLMGEPSHYRFISRVCKDFLYFFYNHLSQFSQAEILNRLMRSKSLCQVANRIVVEANMACDNEREQWDKFKPLPPLPSSPQSSILGAPMDIENTLPSQPPLKRFYSSVLAKRVKQRII